MKIIHRFQPEKIILSSVFLYDYQLLALKILIQRNQLEKMIFISEFLSD